MTRDAWLTAHPYLLSVAHFHEQVENAAAGLPTAIACIPNWHDYEADYLAGVPVLQSQCLGIDLSPVEIIFEAFIARLDSTALSNRLGKDIRDLQVELNRDADASRRAVAKLLGRETRVSVDCGLLQYLGWTVIAHYLSRVVDAFGNWRDEERWLRRYCPTCGSLPVMAQLVGIDPARIRLLSCPYCRTRWQYRRTVCPFCENEDDHRLGVLIIEGEKDLRIDHCESCGGYIKTYNGSGNESLMLADWTSLHLDIIARDRGLHRSATSLYEV